VCAVGLLKARRPHVCGERVRRGGDRTVNEEGGFLARRCKRMARGVLALGSSRPAGQGGLPVSRRSLALCILGRERFVAIRSKSGTLIGWKNAQAPGHSARNSDKQRQVQRDTENAICWGYALLALGCGRKERCAARWSGDLIGNFEFAHLSIPPGRIIELTFERHRGSLIGKHYSVLAK
jgi:hypothetical protein